MGNERAASSRTLSTPLESSEDGMEIHRTPARLMRERSRPDACRIHDFFEEALVLFRGRLHREAGFNHRSSSSASTLRNSRLKSLDECSRNRFVVALHGSACAGF